MSIYGDNIFNESSNDARRKAMEMKRRKRMEDHKKRMKDLQRKGSYANRSNAISKVMNTLRNYFKDKNINIIVDNDTRIEFCNNKSKFIIVKLSAKASEQSDIDKINKTIQEIVSTKTNEINKYITTNISGYHIYCIRNSPNSLKISIQL